MTAIPQCQHAALWFNPLTRRARCAVCGVWYQRARGDTFAMRLVPQPLRPSRLSAWWRRVARAAQAVRGKGWRV